MAEAFLMADDVIAAEEVARRAGCTGRHQLRRRLAAEGFDGPAYLMGSLRIARWLWVAERTGETLSAQELRVGRDASVAYRLVKGRTGLTWNECRRRGTGWFVESFFRAGRRALSRLECQRAVRSSPVSNATTLPCFFPSCIRASSRSPGVR